VIQPVIVDENGAVIDGYHRVKVCKELGIEYPTRVLEGLSEEEKENLSVSLNIKRRHLTKDQKKELALALREQNWTQERIGKVFEVDQRTIGRWLESFRQMPSLDQPSPKIPSEDTEKTELRKQVEYYEKREKEQEKQRLSEIDAKVKARTDAMKEEYQRRFDDAVAKVKAASKPAEIDKLVEQRTAEKIAELEKARREADAERVNFDKEHKEKMASLERKYESKERQLMSQIEAKMKDIDAAQKASLDVSELEKEREHLNSDLSHLRACRDIEQEDSKIRERFRKIQSAVTPLATILYTIKEKISASPNNCGFSVEELECVQKEFEDLRERAGECAACLQIQIEKTRKGGKLHVV
jgi:hypothetical protein